MESEIKTRVRMLLEGQNIMQSKILLDKLKNEKDIIPLVTTQWLPLVTDNEYPTCSKLTAFVQGDEPSGLGSVLLNQE